jgi:hypothetical protein
MTRRVADLDGRLSSRTLADVNISAFSKRNTLSDEDDGCLNHEEHGIDRET